MSTMVLGEVNEEDLLLSNHLTEAENLEANSDRDSVEDPHRSRYLARKIYTDMLDELGGYLKRINIDQMQELIVRASFAGVSLKLGKNCALSDERHTAKDVCMKALKCLTKSEEILNDPLEAEYALNYQSAGVYLSLLNYLGYLAESFEDHENAQKWLRDAETVYNAYKIQENTIAPYDLKTLLKCCTGREDRDAMDIENCKNWKHFDCLHTHTIYYLAQVYKNLDKRDIAADYCEKTLVRQLENDDFEPIDWSLNAATLSQYYLGKASEYDKKWFLAARHCLCAADAIFEQIKQPENDSDSDDKEKFEQCKADIARCWAKYGINLLESSQKSLLSVAVVDREESGENFPENFDDSLAEIGPLFPNLRMADRESQITAEKVTDFETARQVFLKTQKWLNSAKEFYILDYHATDAIELAQDVSRLFKNLIFFEPVNQRKAQMHKRRRDALEFVLQELNPRYFLALARQLLFELGEICCDMVSIKLDILELANNDLPSPHQAEKINKLCRDGVGFFNRFIETYKLPSGEYPNVFDSDNIRPVILAYFYMGRFEGKKITDKKEEKVKFLDLSMENYRWIVDYIENRGQHQKELVIEEFNACKELVDLLPLKINTYKEMLAQQ